MLPLGKCVTYHEACHLVHTQNISQQPRALLQSIPVSQFVELPEAAWCCGSAGIYNVVRTEDSMKFLNRKMDNLASTGADIVITSNPGCHLQLQYGIKQRGLTMEVRHPVSILNKIIRSLENILTFLLLACLFLYYEIEYEIKKNKKGVKP